MSHTVNGKSVSPGGFFGVAAGPACGDECSCPSLAARQATTEEAAFIQRVAANMTLASELQMYSNLVDAVKLIERMVERIHYNCTHEEAELIWRLRFVTRIES